MKSLSGLTDGRPLETAGAALNLAVRFILLILIAVSGSLLIAADSVDAGAAAVREAHALIDASLANRRKLASYRTVSVREQGRGIERVVRQVRNQNSPAQLVREERSFTLPHITPKTVTLVQNYDGIWQEQNGTILKIAFDFRSERPIARRLATAQALCAKHKIPFLESKHLRAQIDQNYDHFGIPCFRITLSLAPELMILLEQDLKGGQKAAAAPAPDAEHRHDTPIPQDVAVTHVYHIAKEIPFVLLFQSYSIDGAKKGEVCYQEFHPNVAIPESAFQRPAGTNVVEIANRDELVQALKSLQSPSVGAR